jgi:hypothetical protein
MIKIHTFLNLKEFYEVVFHNQDVELRKEIIAGVEETFDFY